MLNEKSCGAVVFRKDADAKFLLLRYEAGHWDFVKGNVEPNETEMNTVVRELREETGITEANFIDGFRETITYFYKRQGSFVKKEVVFFIMQTFTANVTLSFEHVGYEWLSYEAALDRLTFRNAKDILRKANQYLETKGQIQ